MKTYHDIIAEAIFDADHRSDAVRPSFDELPARAAWSYLESTSFVLDALAREGLHIAEDQP